MFSPKVLLPILVAFAAQAFSAQVVINEIHYHPVEKAQFDASGNPIYTNGMPADLSDDVHEFVEIYNAGANAMDLSGWRLAGGVGFTFAPGTLIPVGGFKVIAKNPARLQTVYGLTGIFGPFTGKLGNEGDTVRLLNPAGTAVDAVTYSSSFPWAISANALGADDDFTGLDSATYQYKGRSLQRVSPTASLNDPANWVAMRPANGPVTFADQPTPGTANIVSRSVPKPVATEVLATQASDGAAIIRASQQVRITCTFSSTESLTGVQVEYFLENMNAFGEARSTVAMVAGANGQFTATLPGQGNRSIVRYRIKADRGNGPEVVAPRADDPAVVQVGAPTYQASPPKRLPAQREAWSAFFVTPVRTSARQIYDVLVPTDGSATEARFNGINGFQAMAYSCNGNPKRVTATNISGLPRETPRVLPTDRLWNDTVPGVFVHNGVVRNIQIRYHGSRYNRTPSRKSFKVFFPEYSPYRDGAGNEITSIFETDKSDYFMTAHGLHQLAGLPLSTVRYVDWYFNADTLITRLEQGEYNGELLDGYHEKMQRLNPGSVKEVTGEYYKSVGYIISPNTAGEGPYGSGNGWPLPAANPWTELQRFDYTFTLQNHLWKGAKPIKDLVNGLWAARGDSYTSPNPNLVNLKAWFQANWDVDTELTSMALGNWMCPWDDTTQNHFLWRRANGKWVRLLWDFDAMYGTGDGTSSSSSIYLGEVGNPNNNSRGPNYVKDSFIKAFRTEFNQRLWFLNNTLLDPENLQTLTYVQSSGVSNTYYNYINGLAGGFAANRFASVNAQVGQGIFYKPTRPSATSPAGGAAVLPGTNLTSSAYVYNATLTHTAAPVAKAHTSSKWEIRTALGTYDDPAYVLSSTTNRTSLPIPFGELTYGQTYHWRVTYFDADGHPSITSAERPFSYGTASPVSGNITINEVMAENVGAVTNGADRPDYVELKNNTGAAIDISGWKLTDEELNPSRYTFPPGTSIAGGGYLVVWCDANSGSPGLHTGFALSRKGQRVILIQVVTVRDAITFGPQIPDGAIGRMADGTGSWTLVNATPGAANTARPFSTVTSNLKLNEWMAEPASGEDWFELYNSGAQPVTLTGLWFSDTPGMPKTTQIPTLSFLAAGGCVRFDADGTTDGFSSANFKLSSGGDHLVLTAADGLTSIEAVTFGAQQTGVSQGRFPDGTAAITSFPFTASPNDNNWRPASVRINEALSNSVSPLEDFVEIFNPTGGPIDISGWALSDDHLSRMKYSFPPGSVVPAGGRLVVLETAFSAGTDAFSLSSLGDEIVLTEIGVGGETGYRSQVNLGAAADNVSFGYVATAAAPEFWPQASHTMGEANSGPFIGPVIINEIHYHPTDLAGLDNGRDEFVELHNISTNAVDMSGWRLKGGSDFTFAAGTIIRPGDYLLLVAFNPATDGASLAAFRAALGVASTVPIYGPFAPGLANDTTSVEVAYPGAPVDGITSFINMDKVEYTDFAPWPISPDGTGPSLQRISRLIIGNDPAAWLGNPPTPGAVNTGQTAITDNDGDGLPNSWEDAYGFDKFSADDASQDADGDGRGNLAEFIAGTDPRDAASFLSANVGNIEGGFRVQFTAQAGKSYTIEYRDSLASGTWDRLTGIAAPGSTQTVTFDDFTAVAQRFYRVVTPAVP